MRSLFWKIFLWFWVAMIVMALSAYAFVLTTRPDPLPAPWRDAAAGALRAYALASTQEYSRGGQGALRAYLESVGRQANAPLWFFDDAGHELSGAPIPPHGHHSGLMPSEENRPPDMAPLETREKLEDVRKRAARNDLALFEFCGPRVLAAQRVTRGSQNYVLIGSLPTPRFGRMIADPRRQWPLALLLLGLSTLVCTVLVRYLTAPIVELREATRRFSEGDLSARTNAHRKKRRDELADLGRDFDAMASRIEVLLTSQRRLLGDVSHELRSPLARLSMALGLARRHAQSGASAELEEDFNRIAREKERLNELIGGLLELVRLESGQNVEPREFVDLKELVESVAADADFEAQASGKRVLVARSDSCHARGSRELLVRALENVARNAIAYTAGETAVEISLEAGPEYSLIGVRDCGQGVPEDALEKLFEPFYRVESARDRQSGGVGLGLAITRRAVESLGGSISARNAESGGLEIEMRLPRAT